MKFAKLVRNSTFISFSLIALSGCTSNSGDGATTLSGTLSSLQSFKPFNGRGGVQLQTGEASKIACVTANNPPVKVEGTIDGGGAFSVDLSSVVGEPLTCTVLDASDEVLGTFVFQNSNEVGFGGNAQSADTVALNGSTDVGVVSVSGSQVTIDAASLGISTTGQALTAAEAFDPTGEWEIGTPDFTLPAGYEGPCPSGGGGGCGGPSEGESIYIKRVVGKDFTPNDACQASADAKTFTSGDTCNGTTGTNDAFLLSIWMAEDTFKACGNGTLGALGFNEAQAKAYGHVDFSSDTSTLHQAFAYSNSIVISGTTHNLTNGWMSDQATANWDINSCTAVTIDGQTAWKCTDGAGHYSLGLGGGCVNSSAQPIQPDDWNNVKWNTASGCSQEAVTLGSFTLQRNTCTVPYWPAGNAGNAVNLTCGGAWGAFNVADNSPYVDGFGNFQNVTPQTVISSGQDCADIVDGGDDKLVLARLQCYSNYYYQTVSNAARQQTNKCLREVRTDWGATTSANFIRNDGPGRPVNQALVEKMIYLSANVGAMTQIEDEYRGIQVDNGNGQEWLACHTVAKNSITMTKISSTQMIIKFVTETHLADDKAGCVAAAADSDSSAYQQLGLGTSRMLFKMTKQ